MIIARHLMISGHVQGVGFRAWVIAESCKLGLYGWVRNRADGTVEALISGFDDAVQIMIDACRHGPVSAEVSHVAVSETEEKPEPGFRQLPTA